MKIVTEIDLRAEYKNDPFESFVLNPGDRLTPAASQFLNERNIKLQDSDQLIKNTSQTAEKMSVNNLNEKDRVMPKEGYLCLPSGRHVMEKPEHYTHLRGTLLVSKSHPVIKFRGQLDFLEANFVTCVNQVSCYGYKEMADDLNEIFLYLQEIMRAEVLNKPLSFIDFKGWSDTDVREYSHHPDKYFGVKHVLPNPKFGLIYGEVNKLRVMIRQLEITAVEAFCCEEEDRCERLDITMALNRLSSLVYIIICKFIGGHYKV